MIDGRKSRLSIGNVIGADTGGTFTDFVLVDEERRVFTRKVSSHHKTASGENPVLVGLQELLGEAGLEPDRVVEFLHATTVATNAVLERRGASTGLLTTRGFRDVLEIGRLAPPGLYDPLYVKLEPLVDRYLRLAVGERVRSNGQIIQPLDSDEVISQIAWLRSQGVESIAICFLNAWINPIHERQTLDLVQEREPDVFACASHSIAPEIGEYERTSTTVVNAYVGPVTQEYVRRLREVLATLDMRPEMSVMQSNGGLMSTEVALKRPVHLLESGPAAGVVGAQAVADVAGISDCIALDMGGTTAKVSLIEDGTISYAPSFEVGGRISQWGGMLGQGGYPIQVSAIDIAEVGAGGGSIVSVDAGGAVNIGPESAGAFPGPACYGLGGERATITDANVVLGYISPVSIAGGAIPIELDRALRAMREDVGSRLGLDVLEAAWAVHEVANASMIAVIRAVTVQRGRDPRRFILVAFGGSGPLHAVGIARLLDIPRVMVPLRPGLLSTVGLQIAEHRFRRARAIGVAVRDLDPETLRTFYEADQRLLAADLAQSVASNAVFDWSADVRYVGQGYELTLPVAKDISASTLGRLAADFSLEHERAYGHTFPDQDLELVNIRVSSRAARQDLEGILTALTSQPGDTQCRDRASRLAYFGGARIEVPIVSRWELRDGPHIGPFILNEYDSTIIVPPDWTARTDSHGSLFIESRVSS